MPLSYSSSGSCSIALTLCGSSSDAEVEKLLSGLRSESFASRDEQEVAGCADVMEMIFDSYEAITPTENHLKQLHGVPLKYSGKDQDHLGEYKKVPNHVEAFGPDGKSLGVVFETGTPFETPARMKISLNGLTGPLRRKLSIP